MDNQNTSAKTFEKFTWTIKNFSKLDCKELYSDNFLLAGHTWRILIFPKGNNVGDYLSIYLDAGKFGNLPYGWKKIANFKLTLINQVNDKMTKTKETEHQFNAIEIDWGFTTFIPLHELCDSNRGFVVNDTCIIEVEILVSKSAHENKIVQSISKIDVLPLSAQVCVKSEHTDNPLSKEVSTTSFGKVVDFRGLGKIEKAFVPLLEEVCSRHPSLIDSQRKRSRSFTEWAFTALGRVLHFLKTKKVKDMDDYNCNHLQILWEELKTFRFDLTWLEPHFQYALGMKSYVERAAQVKKTKESVVALKMEIKRLKTEMAAAEIQLERARRDLVKAEEDFEEWDLDAELGYGGP